VQRGRVVKAFETGGGQVVPLTPEDLRSLDVIQSTREIQLSTFVPQQQVDPLYFEVPFYLYPDGEMAAEAYQVIATAMAESGTAGLGRVAIRRRERMVLVQPRDGGLILFTLRAADEVLTAEFPAVKALDDDMVAVARAIIERRSGTFEPSTFRDPYNEALRRLAEAKAKGEPIVAKPAPAPSPVADLMIMLRRSLEEDGDKPPAKPKRPSPPDQRQRNLLLPVSGAGRKKAPARPAEKSEPPRPRSLSRTVRRGR
jgi:DNA end-binding protein Ku